VYGLWFSIFLLPFALVQAAWQKYLQKHQLWVTIGIQVTLADNSHRFAKVNFFKETDSLKPHTLFQFTWIMPRSLTAAKSHTLVAAAQTSLRMPKNAPAARMFSLPEYWETYTSCETVAADDQLLS
jgi:hypothetical protein